MKHFTGTISTLQTVGPSGITQKGAGTPTYMAPEILLNKEKNTKYADISVLACTINEIYKQSRTWNCPRSVLVEMIRKKTQPDLRYVPAEIIDIIQQFVSYLPTERPLVNAFCRKYDDETQHWKM